MAKYITNKEIAELLHRVASAYEVKEENRFRIKAYDEASVAVEHSTSELKDLWDEGKLEDVPAVGKSIAEHLDELFRTGKVKHFEKVFRGLPPAMFVLERISGIGPKRALFLAKNLGIKEEKGALEKLKKAAEAGKVKVLENFGEKSEEDLLLGIASLEKGEVKTERMPLYIADSLAEEIIAYLKESPLVIEAQSLGSLRRMLATVGDIDISVSTKEPEKVMKHFFLFPQIGRVLGKGEESLARVILKNGCQVDIRISSPESYGAMLQYFTGSKQHNIHLREYAMSKGMSLSEYGIKINQRSKITCKFERIYSASKYQKDKEKIKNFKDEESFYNFLGLDWIPPEIREDTGEIEAALQKKLPNLVEISDIKGDLHIHSDFPIEPSHDLGESSLEEILQEGKRLGYQYLGFSEHNPAVSQHNPGQIIEILKRKKEFLEKYTSKAGVLGLKIFNGLEIDIQPSGLLAIPEKAFAFLDYAIASIHSSFQMGREEMTARVLAGLSHPKVKILGHPTGRKIGEREGFELDWEKIFAFCLENHKYLEISAWPDRLDLPDFLVREAVKAGLKLVIGSDSHQVDQMRLIRYGVSVGRRGWAESKDIINTLSLEKLSDILLEV